jgi:hypothetical protein
MVDALGPAALAPAGGRRRCFFALMVAAPGPPAPAPPDVPSSMFLKIDGGRSRTFSTGTSWGTAVDCQVKSLR